jgi:hypothetical protein
VPVLRRFASTRGRWTIAALGLAVVVFVGGRAGLNDLIESDIGREQVETGGARALLSAGGGGARLSCPGGLERQTGATVVCSYIDVAAEAARTAAWLSLEDPPPLSKPEVGRVEIRISGWHTRGVHPGSTSDPEFAARVIQPPR